MGSTTAIVHQAGRGRPDFNRWFYSQKRNVDKIDGLTEWEVRTVVLVVVVGCCADARIQGELYFAERFFDHNAQKEFALFW